MASYWDKVFKRRITRRRAIRFIGLAAGTAALLAACNDDKEDAASGDEAARIGSDGNPADRRSDLLWRPVDTTSQARRGGSWKAVGLKDPASFNIYNFDPYAQGFANTIGTKLVYLSPARLRDPGAFDVKGDLAEDWEVSEDKLTYTFKLNPNKKFGPFSPTFHAGAPESIANRVIDSEDVLYSWDRFKTVSSNGSEFANSEDYPNAPIISVEAPDATTVVMKLKQPYSPLLVQLANASVSYFYVIPKEGKEESSDFLDKYMFGGGPFFIDEFKPGEDLILKRNPNFEDPEGLLRPYADDVHYQIVSDPAEQLARFRAGEIFLAPTNFTTEASLALKEEIPELLMWALPDSSAVAEWFGMGSDGPWKDERVRQAVQYTWDRDLFIDVVFSTQNLESLGIPSNRRWNTAIPCGGPGSYMFFPGMWLDPQSGEFGENAKYFTLGSPDANISEAKRLLSAAGYPEGLDFTHAQFTLTSGQDPARDIIEGMMQLAGLRVTARKDVVIPELFDYIFGRGEFSEMLNITDFGGPDVGAFMRAHFHPAGNLFGGWSPDQASGPADAGDPTLNKFVEDVLFEFDNSKRVEIVHDFQRYMAKQFYYSRYPGGATSLRLAWPTVQNWQTFRGYGLDGNYSYEWIDDTKAPLA